MAELYKDGEISNNIATVCSVALRNASLLSNQFGFCWSINDIFAQLLTYTSYICGRLIRFVEELLCIDINRCCEELMDTSSGQHSSCSNSFVSDSGSSFSWPYSASISIGILELIASGLNKRLPVNSRFEIVESNGIIRGITFIFQGLMLPLFALRLSWRLALASWKVSFCYAICTQVQGQVHSIISRAGKTLKGSSDDIGWLQHNSGMAPPEDGSARFVELLHHEWGAQSAQFICLSSDSRTF